MKSKLTLEEAKNLGNKFAEELQKEFKAKLTWWFIGSIKNGNYISGKSDIDMVIIPKNKGMFSVDGVKHILAKMEKYKRYGTVFKKGRDISLIDVVIFFSLKMVDDVRKQRIEAIVQNDK